jgi:hypothetical protein
VQKFLPVYTIDLLKTLVIIGVVEIVEKVGGSFADICFNRYKFVENSVEKL